MAILGMRSEERFEATSQAIIDRFGISLTTGTDFDQYREIVEQDRAQQKLGSPFDNEIHDLNENNAFWLVARDWSGTLVHTQAFRKIELEKKSLASYMRQSFRQYSPVGLDLDLAASRFRPGPGAKRIAGRTVYHGEFWISPDTGDFRGGNLSCVIGRIGFLMVIKKWHPDYVFGLIAKPVAHKGFPMRLGYFHAEPYAVRWKLRHKPNYLEGFLAYMSLEDMYFVLDMPEDEIELLAA